VGFLRKHTVLDETIIFASTTTVDARDIMVFSKPQRIRWMRFDEAATRQMALERPEFAIIPQLLQLAQFVWHVVLSDLAVAWGSLNRGLLASGVVHYYGPTGLVSPDREEGSFGE
jgi:hypothetical protein